jgi:hypothetical protein
MPDLRTSEERGATIERQGIELTPIARSTHLAWRSGGLEWHRPAAIEVRDDAGVRRIAITNATRRTIGLLALAGLGASIGAGWTARAILQGRTRA